MVEQKDFSLPHLRQDITLHRAPDRDGQPCWTIHDPLTDRFYRLDWSGFECLSRFSKYKTASDLEIAISQETTLTISRSDLYNLCDFLKKAGLIEGEGRPVLSKRKNFWQKILHTYLYFTIPLLYPDKALKKIFPKIRFLFSDIFVKTMLAISFFSVLYTVPRADEFFSTFTNLFSLEGILSILSVFFFIKIIHECAHALTAVKYGVAIPHMGVAFIVLYPVLYTETTASWTLSSRKARLNIALAGITAEIMLAGIFLMVWNFSSAGSLLQSLSFLIVCVSLTSSLLINLNPFMRFDGYFILSDILNIDNLQDRSIEFARWNLRRVLFGLQAPEPETIRDTLKNFLIRFGSILLVYRFFLFLGIAFLVYHLFFQPLGAFLFLVEIWWFILRPISNEIKIWWTLKDKILYSQRTLLTGILAFFFIMAMILPWKETVTLPAILHAKNYQRVSAPETARVEEILVAEGDAAKRGDILAVLSSSTLSYEISRARNNITRLEKQARLLPGSVPSTTPVVSLEELEKARLELAALVKEQENLILKAQMDGTIRDLDLQLHKNRTVVRSQPLMLVIQSDEWVITAFATMTEQEMLSSEARGVFYSGSSFTQKKKVFVDTIAQTGQDDFIWPQLGSPFGGPLAADQDPQSGQLLARQSLYKIEARLDRTESVSAPRIEQGYLRVYVQRQSLISSFFNTLWSSFRRETGL